VSGFAEDKEGMNLPSLEAARDEAVIAAKQLVSEAIGRGTPLSVAVDAVFEIKEGIDHVLTVTFAEAAEAADPRHSSRQALKISPSVPN
jgi:hypothetical protein